MEHLLHKYLNEKPRCVTYSLTQTENILFSHCLPKVVAVTPVTSKKNSFGRFILLISFSILEQYSFALKFTALIYLVKYEQCHLLDIQTLEQPVEAKLLLKFFSSCYQNQCDVAHANKRWEIKGNIFSCLKFYFSNVFQNWKRDTN